MRVIITGAASGIGEATAAKFKSAGHEVVGLDIVEAMGVDAAVQVDLADQNGIAAAAGKVRAMGQFDALIQCAGLPPREGLEETILAVNFLGLRQLTDLLRPSLKDGGAVVYVASRAGAQWRDNIDQVKALMAVEDPTDLPNFLTRNPINATRAYNLSKEAVIVLTQMQTEEFLGHGLRVNSVSPAAVDTAILSDFLTAFGERAERGIARMGRAGTVDEIAEVIVFLASPVSGWIKGLDIVVDGGLTAIMTARTLED